MDAQKNVILSRAQVREIDRMAIEDYGIPGIVLMENAARGLANVALDMLEDATHEPPHALIACGKGNNGGDGYALARHLTNANVKVTIASLGDPRPEGDAGINAAICRKMAIDTRSLAEVDDASSYDLVVDALFGTGLDRAIEGPGAEAIEWINASGVHVLAVDVPSGLDCDIGAPLGPVVKSQKTVTFVAMKPGFTLVQASPYLGEVIVVDIGAPVSTEFPS
jgi:NAD(P)H-hydrate epimerase